VYTQVFYSFWYVRYFWNQLFKIRFLVKNWPGAKFDWVLSVLMSPYVIQVIVTAVTSGLCCRISWFHGSVNLDCGLVHTEEVDGLDMRWGTASLILGRCGFLSPSR
jgi:hypothetical protein